MFSFKAWSAALSNVTGIRESRCLALWHMTRVLPSGEKWPTGRFWNEQWPWFGNFRSFDFHLFLFNCSLVWVFIIHWLFVHLFIYSVMCLLICSFIDVTVCWRLCCSSRELNQRVVPMVLWTYTSAYTTVDHNVILTEFDMKIYVLYRRVSTLPSHFFMITI